MLFVSPFSLLLIVLAIFLITLLSVRFIKLIKFIISPLPHVIKQRIDALPEGPEKESRLIRFRAHIRSAIIAYIIAFGTLIALIILFLIGIVLNY